MDNPVVKPTLQHPTEGKIQSGRVLKRSSNAASSVSSHRPPIPSRRPAPSLMKYKSSLRINTSSMDSRLDEYDSRLHQMTQSAPTTPVKGRQRAHETYFSSSSPQQLVINSSNSTPFLLHSLPEEIALPPFSSPCSISNVETRIYVHDPSQSLISTPNTSTSNNPFNSSHTSLNSLSEVDEPYVNDNVPILPPRKSSITSNSLQFFDVQLTIKQNVGDVIMEVCTNRLHLSRFLTQNYELYIARFIDEEEDDGNQPKGPSVDEGSLLSLYMKPEKRRRRRIIRKMVKDEIPLIVHHTFMFMHNAYGSDQYHFILVDEQGNDLLTSNRIGMIMNEQQFKSTSIEKLQRRLKMLEKEEEREVTQTRKKYSQLLKWTTESYKFVE